MWGQALPRVNQTLETKHTAFHLCRGPEGRESECSLHRLQPHVQSQALGSSRGSQEPGTDPKILKWQFPCTQSGLVKSGLTALFQSLRVSIEKPPGKPPNPKEWPRGPMVL